MIGACASSFVFCADEIVCLRQDQLTLLPTHTCNSQSMGLANYRNAFSPENHLTMNKTNTESDILKTTRL